MSVSLKLLFLFATLHGTQADSDFAKSMLQAWMNGPQKMETLLQMSKTPGFRDGACHYIAQAMALRPNNSFLFQMGDACGCGDLKEFQDATIKLPEHDGIEKAWNQRQKQNKDPEHLAKLSEEQRAFATYEAKSEEDEMDRYTQATLRHSAASAMKLTTLFYSSHDHADTLDDIHDFCDDDTTWEIVTSEGSKKGKDCAKRWRNFEQLCKPTDKAEDFACQPPGICHVNVVCGQEEAEFHATESLRWNLETRKLASVRITPPALHPGGKDL